jgi:tRNA(adenine34) deaminase
MNRDTDLLWMRQALDLAKQGAAAGEVPVGAVLVLDNKIIGSSFNKPISQQDPCAHAEIMALRAGGTAVNNYRLINSTLYVTLEPCMMCAGAMVHARIQRLVYAAKDPKAGAVVSKMQLLDQGFLNHRVVHEGGVMEEECGALLSEFFRAKR